MIQKDGIDSVEADLDNGTDGLSALKTLLDAVGELAISTFDADTDGSQASPDVGTFYKLKEITLSRNIHSIGMSMQVYCSQYATMEIRKNGGAALCSLGFGTGTSVLERIVWDDTLVSGDTLEVWCKCDSFSDTLTCYYIHSSVAGYPLKEAYATETL